VKNIIHNNNTEKYCTQYDKISGVAPKNINNGLIKINHNIVNMAAIIILVDWNVQNTLDTSQYFFCHNFREIIDDAHIPRAIANAHIIIWIGKTIDTAAIPSVPTPLPIKIVSTKLYNDITSIQIIAGADWFNNNFDILSSHI